MARTKERATSSAAPLLTLADVAEYLSVANRTVYLWVQADQIPGFKLGNIWRFKKDDIEQWIEERRAATPRKEN